MQRQIKTEELTWTDIVDLNKEDLEFLASNYTFHTTHLNELLKRSTRPKFEEHQGYIFLIVHTPFFNPAQRSTTAEEVNIFITHNEIVTVHMGRVHLLDKFFNEVSEEPKLIEHYVGRDAAYLLHSIMSILIDSAFPKLDHIFEKIEIAEREIFAGKEREMVYELSLLSRDISGFAQIMRPQVKMFDPGILRGDFATPSFKAVFKSLESKLERVWSHLETLKERVESLSTTNSNMLSHKLNEFIKILTLISALFIPISVICAGLPFFHETPLVSLIIFWLFVTLLIIIDFMILWYYRAKKLL